MTKSTILYSLLFLLTCTASRSQCPEDFNLKYGIDNAFNCSVSFELSFTSQNQYESALLLIRNCDLEYQSESVKSIELGDNVLLPVELEDACNCGLYEGFLILTYRNEDGDLESTQCPTLPLDLSAEFNPCPSFSEITKPVTLNGEHDCSYHHIINVDAAMDFDYLDLHVSDCKGFEESYRLLNVKEGINEIGITFRNECNCDALEIAVSLAQGDDIRNCQLGSFFVDQYAFITFPLELENFGLRTQEKQLFVEWSTLFEISLSAFSVEYSEDGSEFRELFQVEAQETSAEYSYQIENNTGYYRLRVVNQNGAYGFSSIIYHENLSAFNLSMGRLILKEVSDVDIFDLSGRRMFAGAVNLVDFHQLGFHGICFVHINGELVQSLFIP